MAPPAAHEAQTSLGASRATHCRQTAFEHTPQTPTATAPEWVKQVMTLTVCAAAPLSTRPWTL